MKQAIIISKTRKRTRRGAVTNKATKKILKSWNALAQIAKIKGKPMGWSKDDEVIYSV